MLADVQALEQRSGVKGCDGLESISIGFLIKHGRTYSHICDCIVIVENYRSSHVAVAPRILDIPHGPRLRQFARPIGQPRPRSIISSNI